MLKKLDNKGLAGVVEIVLIVAAVAVIGFVVFNSMGSSDELANQSDDVALPTDLTALVEPSEMEALVLSELGEASVVSVELEVEDGVSIYVYKLSDGRELVFDATTGTLLDQDTYELESEDEALPAGFVASVSMAQAVETARAEQPDKDVMKVELEVEEGIVVYKVKFADDSRVEVDATTGDVVRVRVDNDDADEDEDSNDDDDDSNSNDDDSDDNDDSDDEDEDDDDDEEDDDDESDNSGSGSSN